MRRTGGIPTGLLALAFVVLVPLDPAALVALPDASAPARATLEWKATQEEGVYGYLVYRATDRDGPYRRLGKEIVHVSSEPGAVHSYRFDDDSVESGKIYYYYLDKIASSGVKSRFSGVVSKKVD